jgi:NAD-dependent oxidoreductase involved in siderophore biosynthesis
VIDIKIGDRDVMLLLTSVNMFDVTDNGETKQTRYKAALKFEFPEGYLPKAAVADVRHAIEAVVATEADVAAASTKTIALGQTRAQVEEILGKPERIVDLGAKVMYVYKDMKVTFVDGKVTDVQ